MQLWNLKTTGPTLFWTDERSRQENLMSGGLTSGGRWEQLRPVPHLISPVGGSPRSPRGVHFRIDSHMGRSSEVVRVHLHQHSLGFRRAALWSTSLASRNLSTHDN